MRTFIALDLTSQELRGNISSVQNRIAKTGASLKIIEPDKVHFTMRFLGEVDQALLEEIRSRLGKLKTAVFSVSFVGLGAFPSADRISVIWIGVDEESAKKMKSLAYEIGESLNDLPLKREGRPFAPHLTIARVRRGSATGDLRAIIEAESSQHFGEETFAQLKLKKSDLTRHGPIYTDLEVIDL